MVDVFAVYLRINDATDTSGRIEYNGKIEYTDTWSYGSGRGYGDYQDDVNSTRTNKDSATFTFVGTAASYIAEKNSDEGDIDVYVNGTYKGTVNAYNATRLPQQVLYSVSGLAYGVNTIKLVKKCGTYMLVDGFDYR